MKVKLIVALLLAAGTVAYPQSIISPPRLAEFSNESVPSIYQDKGGAMWFNVGNNLYRYNGRSSRFIVGPIPASRITGDSKGHIYVPRFNSILRVNTETSEIEPILAGQLEFKNIALQCQGDSLWIASEGNVILFSGDSVVGVTGIGEQISAMTLSASGNLLVGTSQGGVYSITPEVRKLRAGDSPVTTIYTDSHGHTWISHGKTVECMDTGESHEFQCEIRAISEDGNRRLLAAGTKGLFCVMEDGRVVREALTPTAAAPVTCLFRDRDDAVWIGTYYDGIQYLDRRYSQFSYLEGDFQLVKGIVEGSDGNELWVMTDGNGMFHSRAGHSERVGGTDGIKFQCACRWGDCIVCGTFTEGVFIFESTGRLMKKVRFKEGDRSVFAVCPKGDEMLIGTDSGLYIFNPRTESHISRHFNGLNSHVYSIVSDPSSGRLWVGSNGLFLSDDGKSLRKFEKNIDSPLSGKKCSSLGFRSDGSLLFSTSGAGIYEIRDGDVISFNGANAALPTDNISQCIEVNDSLILAGFADGLVLLNTRSSSCHTFGRAGGLRISSMKGGCLTCAGGGTIYAGGKDGIAFIHKDDVVFSTDAVDIKFDRFTVNNLAVRIPEDGHIGLSHDERNFTVEVADMNYSEIPSLTFEYRLEGFEKEWHRVPEDMRISYMNLRPGKYRLTVRTSTGTSDGAAAQTGLDIRLRPAWYASTISVILWILLSAGLVSWILSILYSRILLREQLRSQEQTSKERNRMFIDISHQLRTPLTMILGQMELFFSKHSERFPGRGHIESSYSNAKEMRRIISEFVDFENTAEKEPAAGPSDYKELSLTPIGMGRYRMLVVDDNQSIRMLLKSIFSDEYDVMEASDGEEGIRLAKKEQPDIILSDVQMPAMDGITMTSRIKSDQQTRHIPVILITAHASEKHNIEGLNMGADDYITKPFSNEILKARCRNLLRSRELMKERLKTAIGNGGDEGGRTSKFVNTVLGAIERNLPKPDVPSICSELGMSRTSLTNKIKEATGMTPREYIEDIKLKIAANMIIEGGYNISEISDRLGFNNPKYFTARFHMKYGCAPSKYGKERN